MIKDKKARAEWSAKYYQRNKDRIKEFAQKRLEENPEKIKQQKTSHRNKIDQAKYLREYRDKNPLSHVSSSIKQRIKKETGIYIKDIPEQLINARLSVVIVKRLIQGLPI